jgi:hypothetical protein
MRFFSTAVAVLAGSLCLPGLVSAQPASEKVTPSELLAKKDELTNKQVTVEGTLTNSGTNYFTDLRVLLKDNKDSQSGVLVQPWLPVETPPRQTSRSSSTPTLSDFLGKKVEIRGVLTDSVVKHVGSSKVLRVESARTID